MHDHLIATIIIVAALALFACLATAAGINNRRREGQALDDHFNSHRLPGEGDVLGAGAVEPDDASPIYDQTLDDALAANGLSHWTTVSADDMQPFEESLRQVRVIDFEEGA